MKKNEYSSSKNKNNITIKIEVPIELHAKLKLQAQKQNITLQHYCSTKLADCATGVNEIRNAIIKSVPDYYNHVAKIADPELKSYFYDFGGFVCRL